jgi:hypothetical protein
MFNGIADAQWLNMDSPLKFRNNADVIAEEAARWRALTPEEWVKSYRGILRAGALMLKHAQNQEYQRRYRQEQKELARRAIKELIARHAQ